MVALCRASRQTFYQRTRPLIRHHGHMARCPPYSVHCVVIYRLKQAVIFSAVNGGRNMRQKKWIIEACADRDADRAEAAVAAHFQAALQRILGML
jgi:DNA-binding GntR family transcriptional regulator